MRISALQLLGAFALLAPAISLVVSGCIGPGQAVRTFVPNFEPGLRAGSLHLTSEPEFAARRIVIEYTSTDGAISPTRDVFAPGERVSLTRTFMVGVHELLVDSARCGVFNVELERETDVILRIGSDSCSLAFVNVHGPDAAHPSLGATSSILGRSPPGATVTLRDVGLGAAFRQVKSDESGAFRFDGLPPGRYAVSASPDADSAREIELSPGQTVFVEFAAATTP